MYAKLASAVVMIVTLEIMSDSHFIFAATVFKTSARMCHSSTCPFLTCHFHLGVPLFLDIALICNNLKKINSKLRLLITFVVCHLTFNQRLAKATVIKSKLQFASKNSRKFLAGPIEICLCFKKQNDKEFAYVPKSRNNFDAVQTIRPLLFSQ